MSSSPGAVLHVVPSSPFGGAQRVAIDLAMAQRARGRDATLLGTRPGERFEAAAREAGVPVATLPHALRHRISGLRAAARRADIVHLHLWAPWYPLALRGHSRIATHLHSGPSLGVHGLSLRALVHSLSDRHILNQSAHVLAITDWIGREWRGHGLSAQTPCDTVLNGIRIPRQRLPRKVQGTVIGVASRLTRLKGLEELVDAMAALQAAGRGDISLCIVGDGPERTTLEARAGGLPITFVGYVSDMDRFWAETDLSIFTAPREPFGLRLIEPAARGIPVVAYRNGTGSDEVIALCRGVSAVPYGDSAALAREIIDILDSPARYERMSREGRQDCETHFSLDAMADGVDAVYAKMLT